MDFSKALHRLKEGLPMAREGWNAGGQFIYLVPKAVYKAQTDVAKKAFPSEDVPYGAYLAIKTVQGTVVPWLASQTDMLAEDWVEVDLSES